MADGRTGRVVDIVSAGRIARRAMRDGARGAVRAVFERSFYITLEGQWICVGPQALGEGPLNARWRTCGYGIDLPCRAAPVSLAGATLTIAGRAFANVELGPEPPTPGRRPWSVATLWKGLRCFDGLAPRLAPVEGLASLVAGGAASSRVAAEARAPVAHLDRLVRAAAWSSTHNPLDVRPLMPLLGLGPGLTPSGDDLLGGALVALDRIGRHDLRDATWLGLASEARSRTNEVALAHLAAAGEGECSPALAAAAEALLCGACDELPGALAGVATIGHTSGWDALAGVVLVLRAAAAAQAGAAPAGARESLA